MGALSYVFMLTILCCSFLIHNVAFAADYGSALTKSILFFEGQRSGKLPPNQRVQWRGDSALTDGQSAGVDLVGGYYDAGDNLKLGFPFAFTMTMLSWSTIEFEDKLTEKNELDNALSAIKWGTDYFIKAHTEPNVLYGEVGEPDSDHQCWQRPEDMTTPRDAYKIDEQNPGSDLAAETAAAFAAASIAFKTADPNYSSTLQLHAVQLFDFAKNHQGSYSDSISAARKVYSSSGYKDELLWAAAWLYRATELKTYLDYLGQASDTGGVRSTFSWDDKFTGAQLLVAKLLLDGKVDSSGVWAQFKSEGEDYICSLAGKGTRNVAKTPAGLFWFLPDNNSQYVTSATFLMSVYAKYLTEKGSSSLQCNGGAITPSDLQSLVKAQVDYLLGSNPKGLSYMVGYGPNYPQQIHHRAASIVSIKEDATPVTCKGGFDQWFNRNAPNPNVLEGAVVSTDGNDNYNDDKNNYQTAEPSTVVNGPLVGVLAYLA
ncbi:hypothetical protein TanjilG_28840 [Lupinus angustifolius]|uniref:Endoglucanase n=1 Tax=Lupinus angustifolius TaxID=3871 RepID=A0A4P1R8S0_LUPAN|nr:PREDICTED: endoglucanase 14-like [Lupinus angustifolius]OIW05375.1 hypothetical protein TanjilG_28840 [Lupinus angustifolius]